MFCLLKDSHKATIQETAEGTPADDMTQQDEVEETWVSVVASDAQEWAMNDKFLSRQKQSSSAAPKGKVPKVRAKKKPGQRGHKFQSSKQSDLAEIIGVSEPAGTS